MRALLLAAASKVEDAHGSIIFSRTSRPMPPPGARQHVAVLQVPLRRLADEYQTIADELEDDEISDKHNVD